MRFTVKTLVISIDFLSTPRHILEMTSCRILRGHSAKHRLPRGGILPGGAP
jgi:hypothetical protein